MKCQTCFGKRFIFKEPKTIKKQYYCKKTNQDIEITYKIGGTDICPQCQKISEIEYQAQSHKK